MKFSDLFKTAIFTATSLFVATTAMADSNTVTVYTYNSFTSDWGPGPLVEKAFEAECGCDLKWVTAEDAGGILSRLQLEGANSTADVALGLDQNMLQRAKNTGLFATHNSDLSHLELPNKWTDTSFVPFDYGHLAFIYDSSKIKNPPRSLEELVNHTDLSIIIQDPRTSSPGLNLMLWIKAVYGDQAGETWTKLSKKIVTTTKGWSEAYGMFLEGESDMVLSYTTSPAYHMEVEQVHKYKAAAFSEGHYEQIEVAAKLKNAHNPELADKFLQFITSDSFQSLIPTNNWMLPVVKPSAGMPASFGKDKIHYPAKSLHIDPAVIADNNQAWVDEWLEAVSQ